MEGGEIMIPHFFRCPISLDLFEDPVTLCTGHTYDRFFIEKWIAAGNKTCPVTMQKLQDSSMVPNHTVRHLIDEWLRINVRMEPDCSENGIDVSIVEIRKVLESDEVTLENKVEALEKVHSLSQELPLRNSCLIKLDFFGLLLELVFRNGGRQFEKSSGLVEKALVGVLDVMPFSDLATLNHILIDEAKYANFLSLFQKGNVFIKKSLCLLVEATCSSVETHLISEKIGKSEKFLQEVVGLVEKTSEVTEAGIRALSALALTESNIENLVQNGAVQAMLAYILRTEKQKGSLAAMAMCTIEKLLAVERVKRLIMDYPCGVDAIVKMVFRVSDHEESESAVNSLLILCIHCKSVREKIVLCGCLNKLLLLLQSQCSVRIKTKARMLLKLLRSM